MKDKFSWKKRLYRGALDIESFNYHDAIALNFLVFYSLFNKIDYICHLK
jgi:hypothetical protein